MATVRLREGRLTTGVSDVNVGTLARLTIAKDTIVDILKGGERNALDDGSGNDGQQQEGKGDEEQDGERRGGFEQHGEY